MALHSPAWPDTPVTYLYSTLLDAIPTRWSTPFGSKLRWHSGLSWALSCVMLCYAMLCYAMLCYAIMVCELILRAVLYHDMLCWVLTWPVMTKHGLLCQTGWTSCSHTATTTSVNNAVCSLMCRVPLCSAGQICFASTVSGGVYVADAWNPSTTTVTPCAILQFICSDRVPW